MKISEVMTREVQTIEPDQTAQEAAKFMLRADAGSIPVTEGEQLLGMITDRDIAVRGTAKGLGPDATVEQLMTSDVVCARDTDDVLAIAQQMSDKQVRRMPVIDSSDSLIGMVSLGDLSRQGKQDAATTALEGVTAPGGEHQQ